MVDDGKDDGRDVGLGDQQAASRSMFNSSSLILLSLSSERTLETVPGTLFSDSDIKEFALCSSLRLGVVLGFELLGSDDDGELLGSDDDGELLGVEEDG